MSQNTRAYYVPSRQSKLTNTIFVQVPAGSPSGGGDVAVYVFDINQPSLPTPLLFCSCVYFCRYGPFNCISFHKSSRQLSVLSLCSFGLLCSVLNLSRMSPRAHLHVVGMLWFMSDINQPSLPTIFYSVLVSVSVFMARPTVFHSINSPDSSPFSHSGLPVLSLCSTGRFNYISLYESLLQPRYNPQWLTGLKTPITYLPSKDIPRYESLLQP